MKPSKDFNLTKCYICHQLSLVFWQGKINVYYNQDCFTGGITGNMTKDRDFCLGIKFGFRGKCIIYDL